MDQAAGANFHLGLSSLHHQGGSRTTLANTITVLTDDPNFSATLVMVISFVFGGGAKPSNNGNTNNVNVTTTNINNNGTATTSNNTSHG